MSANKSDRSLSPAAMSEESRRELIARQHRALYGSDSPAFFPHGEDGQRPENQPSTTPTLATTGGPSSRAVDPFSPEAAAAVAGPSPVAAQTKSPTNSTSSPSSSANAAAYGFNTSASSPGGSAPDAKAPAPSVGPIGSRPAQPATTQAPNPALNKRSTTPLPSPLAYGFSPSEAKPGATENAGLATPSTQAPAAPGATGNESSPGVGLGWSGGNNVWRSKNSLGVQASVWG